MYTAILAPIVEDDVLALHDEVKTIARECAKIRERLSNVEGRINSTPTDRFAHPLFVAIVSIVGVALVSYLAWVGIEINSQGKAIENIKTLLSPQIIQDSASHAADPKSAKKAMETLRSTISRGEHIDPNVISDAGKKLVSVSRDNPTAWQAAMEFASYRTRLNSVTPRGELNPLPAGILSGAQFSLNYDPKDPPAVSFSRPHVVPEDAAVIDKIGGSDEPQQRLFGALEMWIKGGSVNIDNTHFKHVVFNGVEIHYSGQPVILEDVVFVNCKFIFDNTEPTRDLVQTLLESPTINFQIKS